MPHPLLSCPWVVYSIYPITLSLLKSLIIIVIYSFILYALLFFQLCILISWPRQNDKTSSSKPLSILPRVQPTLTNLSLPPPPPVTQNLVYRALCSSPSFNAASLNWNPSCETKTKHFFFPFSFLFLKIFYITFITMLYIPKFHNN